MIDEATRILLEALMSQTTKRKVKARRKKAICLADGCNEPSQTGCRGRCSHHYNQFEYARRKLPTQRQRDLFDATEVASGNILPSARGRCRKRPNPYLQDAV